MAIKVKFFASLREDHPNSLDQVDVDGPTTVSDIWQCATSTTPMPSQVLCSINLEHSTPDAVVNDGDEVAFFPPVTGG